MIGEATKCGNVPTQSWRGKSAVFRIYSALTSNGYRKSIKAVRRQRNLGLISILRDRPFNLKGGLWFFVSFRIIFFDSTNYFFSTARIFFPGYNIRLYDKNSESDFFFFPQPKSEYFFQQHWESEYFFRKKTYPPSPPPLQVKWSFPNHNVCLYYWLYHSSKVRYLNKTFRPTMKNHHLLIKLLLSGQVELNPGGLVVPVVEMSIGAVKPLNVIHVKPGIILTAKVVWTPQCTI